MVAFSPHLWKLWESTRVAVFIISWIIFSAATICFNKWILSSTSFHYPMFLTANHMLFATIVTFILRYVLFQM